MHDTTIITGIVRASKYMTCANFMYEQQDLFFKDLTFKTVSQLGACMSIYNVNMCLQISGMHGYLCH